MGEPLEKPYFDVHIVCMADSKEQLSEWLDEALQRLPFPNDVTASVEMKEEEVRDDGGPWGIRVPWET